MPYEKLYIYQVINNVTYYVKFEVIANISISHQNSRENVNKNC